MRAPYPDTPVPTRLIGPLLVKGETASGLFSVPLATYESPLWASTQRGGRVSRQCDGIKTIVLQEKMTRSIILEARDGVSAVHLWQKIHTLSLQFREETSKTSRFCTFQEVHGEVIGPLLYLRFAFTTGDAAGHNMATKAAEALLNFLLNTFKDELTYVSVSGNLCTDKKVSAINGILGRGRHTMAEILIPRDICTSLLKVTPQEFVNCFIKKNLMGSILAGSIRSANAHVANLLLALYVATGQDAANIVEGSQAITFAEEKEEGLYFSVTLPNLIIGTCGVGKDLPFAHERLEQLGCSPSTHEEPGKSAQRLAEIMAATVLCGELSLLAALAQPGELVKAHMRLERSKKGDGPSR